MSYNIYWIFIIFRKSLKHYIRFSEQHNKLCIWLDLTERKSVWIPPDGVCTEKITAFTNIHKNLNW